MRIRGSIVVRARLMPPIIATILTLASAFVLSATFDALADADASRGERALEQEWRFEVFLEDNPIGRQVFRLSRDGDRERMVTEARFDVKFFFITAYSYRHRNEEVWRDGCLHEISSNTDDNGRAFRVRGAARDDGFVVATGERTESLSECVRSFAYWNPLYLRAPKLLNSQTGDYEEVTLTSIGEEMLEANGRSLPARRYALVSPNFRIDLWYSPQDEWLALESSSKSGRKLRYVLED
jgi:hypothetical protein